MSALRINLLPAYIAETRNTKMAIGVFSALFIAAVAGSLFYFTVQQGITQKMEEEATQKTAEASAAAAIVTAIKGESTQLRAQIAPIGDRVRFVKDVQFYNTWVQKIYRRAGAYTDRNVEYSSMAVTTDVLTMTGFVSGANGTSPVDNLSRYLITFYGNPDVTAVTVSPPPGWQRPGQTNAATNPLEQNATAASQRGFGFSVTAKLLKPLVRPQLPATLSDAPAVTEPGGAPAAAGTPGTAPAAAPPPSEEDR